MAALFPELLRLWKGPRVSDRLVIVRQSLSSATVAASSGRAPASQWRYGASLIRLTALLQRYGPTLWRLCRRDPHLLAAAEDKAQLAHWLRPFAVSDNHEGPLLPPAR